MPRPFEFLPQGVVRAHAQTVLIQQAENVYRHTTNNLRPQVSGGSLTLAPLSHCEVELIHCT